MTFTGVKVYSTVSPIVYTVPVRAIFLFFIHVVMSVLTGIKGSSFGLPLLFGSVWFDHGGIITGESEKPHSFQWR